MANTKISDLGPEIALSSGGETRIPALGNGTAKPGHLVGITDATGKVVGTDIGASELFHGILDKGYKTDIDTAIPDGTPCSVIVPKSGRKYRIFCTDQGGAVVSGMPWKISETAGSLTANTNMVTAGNVALNDKAIANDDLVGEYIWL
jgi:hypothetical protein